MCKEQEEERQVFSLKWCIAAELTQVHNFFTNEQICLELQPWSWSPSASPPMLQAVSCIGSAIQVL